MHSHDYNSVFRGKCLPITVTLKIRSMSQNQISSSSCPDVISCYIHANLVKNPPTDVHRIQSKNKLICPSPHWWQGAGHPRTDHFELTVQWLCTITRLYRWDKTEHYSQSMTTPTKSHVPPRRLRLAWALFAQSHQSSLCALWVVKDTMLPHDYSKASDLTAQMLRLIRVFAVYIMWFCRFCHDLAHKQKIGKIGLQSTSTNLCIKDVSIY